MRRVEDISEALWGTRVSSGPVSRLNQKLSDYFQMGVRYVWVLDPLSKRAFCYTPGEMHEVLDGVLRTNNPDIAVPLTDAFEE